MVDAGGQATSVKFFLADSVATELYYMIPRPRIGRAALIPWLLPALLGAQKFNTYIGQIGATSALIAWGTTVSPGNTIGRSSKSYGRALVTIGSRMQQTNQNWAVVEGLDPDTSYSYRVDVTNKRIGEGIIRTYPARTDHLAFFVIGDFGTGESMQYKIAGVMRAEFMRRRNSDNPVRFVITTGDNIYASMRMGQLAVWSGDEDRHWESKFFRPYERLLAEIPFYPSPGNHDGNESENRADLPVYLDNFFFPQNRPSRWYTFSFGQLADFYALDSTSNTEQGPLRPAYARDGEQFRWLVNALPRSQARWKIPYFHHPPFNAGPGHPASLDDLKHFTALFQRSGVRVVFNGHEHNFQFSAQDRATGGIRYVISGAGAELRPASVIPNMEKAHIAGWAGQNHFLLVEIRGEIMSITPISFEAIRVRDKNDKPVPLPVEVRLPAP